MNPILGNLLPALVVAASEPGSTISYLAPLLDLGISTVLVGLIVWFIRQREKLISTGEWVPRRELDYIREDRDTRLAQSTSQCSDWRAAYDTERGSREITAAQNTQLIEALRAQERFFDAFRSVLERLERERDRNDGDGL